MNEVFLTAEQLAKIKEEYEYYVHVKRPEVVQRIKEAKSFGDLSENSEYDSARDEQAFVEQKIKELNALITNAQIIQDNVSTDIVALGTTVEYENIESKQKYEFRIVGVGADPLHKTKPSISTGTEVARVLLGKKVSDVVDLDVPSGRIKLKILKIK